MDQQYEDFKKQVKDSSDIVDVIGGYISLQKKGRYYWACCPFHGEKTPSFSVDKERQFFYCYGIRNDSFFTVTVVIPGEMYLPLYRK